MHIRRSCRDFSGKKQGFASGTLPPVVLVKSFPSISGEFQNPDYAVLQPYPRDYEKPVNARSVASKILTAASFSSRLLDKESLYDLNRRWRDAGDHHDLFELLRAGALEKESNDDTSLLDNYSRGRIGQICRTRGYKEPFAERTDAARLLARTRLNDAVYNLLFNYASASYLFGQQTISPVRMLLNLRESVYAVKPNFIASQYSAEGQTIIFDQLWAVRDQGSGVRLLAIVFDDDKVEAQLRSEAMHLSKSGYEVFAISEVWTITDPFRTVLEFLHAAKLFPAPADLLDGIRHLVTPMDYICPLCSSPMERSEIESVVFDKSMDSLVHAACLDLI